MSFVSFKESSFVLVVILMISVVKGTFSLSVFSIVLGSCVFYLYFFDTISLSIQSIVRGNRVYFLLCAMGAFFHSSWGVQIVE